MSLAAAMTRSSQSPKDPWRMNTPPLEERNRLTHAWKKLVTKLFYIGRMAVMIQRFKVCLGSEVYNKQFGTLVSVAPAQKKETVTPQSRRVTFKGEEYVLGESLGAVEGIPRTAPDLCQHPQKELSLKGSNQHQLRFLCHACRTAFQRHRVADLHPNPQRPPTETDRITWGTLFGETYLTASMDSHFKQLSLMMAEDPAQSRPWIVRFATFCIMREGLEASLNPQHPVTQMVTQIRTQAAQQHIQLLEEDLTPDDSISMASVRLSQSSAGRTRSRLN